MNKKEIIITLIITIAILFFSALNVFGTNNTETPNENVIENETNTVRPLTLKEQKNQVQDAPHGWAFLFDGAIRCAVP